MALQERSGRIRTAQQWVQEEQAQVKANILGAIVGGIFGGGGDDSGGDDGGQDRFTEQRREREYWGDRARRAEAVGNQAEADFARQSAP